MNVLAFDTTRRTGSLALWLSDALAEAVLIEAPDGFGSVLYQQIDELLARHETTLAEIDGFAAASGPGSFTGIRVGLSAVKALAEIHGKPAVAVSNLKAIAAAAQAELRIPLLDARRGEVFAACYDGELQEVFKETVCNCAELVERFRGQSPTYIAADASIFESAAPAEPASAQKRSIVNPAIAQGVAEIAVKELAAGRGQKPEQIDANYIRRPDAEVNWKGR
jgi:tRNA threonylcarbamoyladenosine biosynthesis protein TsaB